MTAPEQPYRLVDANNHGWLITIGGAYRPDPERPYDLAGNLPYAEVAERFGPVRPVEAVTDADEALLTGIFLKIGRKTITTLAAALELVFHELRASKGGLSDPHVSANYAETTLLAGRPGSWASALLLEIVWFGNSLNLAKPTRTLTTVEARRTAGPSHRVDRDGRALIAEVIRRWVTGPDRYVEVAETLAAVVSRYADAASERLGVGHLADRIGGTDGWKQVADQWLMPGGLAQDDFSRCYRLFYSVGGHFNTNLI